MDNGINFLDLDWVLDTVIDERCKSWPTQLPPTRIRDLASLRLNLFRGDLPTPVAILRRRALDINSEWMRRFLERTGTVICPHGKTTMAPQLFARQLGDGAWGITVATRHQLAIARRAGIRRLILANEIVTQSDMDYVTTEFDRDPEVELYLYVDSLPLVRRWSEVRERRPGRSITLLLEVGYRGGRTGARTHAEAIEIAEAIHAAPGLRLCGVAGFEGLIDDNATSFAVDRVTTFLGQMVEVAQICAERGLFGVERVILTAGGSAYYDLVANAMAGAQLGCPSLVVLRSGCYLTHDHNLYARYLGEIVRRSAALAAEAVRPTPALEVWASVQSRPEADRAVCSIGKRDVSFDVHLPKPISWCRPGRDLMPQPLAGHVVDGLNDQHALVRLPEDSPVQVGDLVGFGVSHPCTTFDRWPLLFLIDETGTVVDGIQTYF
jgi:D-serine dehydratase